MVPRYARPAMTAIWEPEARYRIWFEIEAHATDKMGELGVVPKSAGKALWDWWATNPAIDVAAIDAIEAVTKHDVIAFLTWVAEQVGDDARFMHQGMTSSDVLDTTLAVQLARAADILIDDIDALLAALKKRAFEHKHTPTIGRSHGIRPRSARSWPKPMRNSPATAPASSPRAPRSRLAPSPARSELSRISTHRSKSTWPRSCTCRWSLSPRRSSRATGTRCSSSRWR
jgi:hypothetical protein